ncbi:MAG: cobyric acid synthase [Gammaproteobacteria bacterium]|nr:cobyric acid synthase [Gammaproteobacteria bacterium]
MSAKVIMIQGTTSDAGKSIAVTALCRWLKRKGYKVAPFKPQNMALNSAVTDDGGEIGRAQALQALACELPLSVHFNPVLLKPSSDQSSQVIIHGKAVDQLTAKKFGNIKKLAFNKVLESFQYLKEHFDYIVVEGAGSPAEINLRENDIANMGFAEEIDCSVVLISDIDRGGVFAHIVGTLQLLSESERNRIKGFIINKFRGSIELLQSGIDWLEKYCQRPVYGTIPFIQQLKLDAEDAINIEQSNDSAPIKIKIPVFSRISNHTDFDALRWHPKVDVQFIGQNDSLKGADLIILPGSKNVRADLNMLLNSSWLADIKQHLRYGGKLMGICGGFQMLGNKIDDPLGIEDLAGSTSGLGLLDFITELEPQKKLTQVSGHFSSLPSAPVSGYEIHCGISQGPALKKPLIKYCLHDQEYTDGAISGCGSIIGTYLHGIFDSKEACTTILNWVEPTLVESIDFNQVRISEIDRLTDHFAHYCDFEKLIDSAV